MTVSNEPRLPINVQISVSKMKLWLLAVPKIKKTLGSLLDSKANAKAYLAVNSVFLSKVSIAGQAHKYPHIS